MPYPTNKAENATIFGVSQIIVGGAILFIFGAGALVSRVFSWFTNRPGTLSLALFLIGVVGGACFLWRGIDNLTIAAGFRKVKGALGNSKYIQLSTLEQKLGWDRRKLTQSLQQQMERRFWPEAFLDLENGAFMPEVAAAPYIHADTGDNHADGMLVKANGHIHDLMALSFSIQDTQVKNQIEQLLVITKQIYGYVRSNPEKARQISRFSDYHLPTAVSLLQDFQGLESQAVHGSNIQASMQKIRESMPSFENAFRQQLDGLYQDKAMNIAVEVKVLQKTMDEPFAANTQD